MSTWYKIYTKIYHASLESETLIASFWSSSSGNDHDICTDNGVISSLSGPSASLNAKLTPVWHFKSSQEYYLVNKAYWAKRTWTYWDVHHIESLCDLQPCIWVHKELLWSATVALSRQSTVGDSSREKNCLKLPTSAVNDNFLKSIRLCLIWNPGIYNLHLNRNRCLKCDCSIG